MSDETVTVRKDDLREVLDEIEALSLSMNLSAVLRWKPYRCLRDALGSEPCPAYIPTASTTAGTNPQCILPKGHHRHRWISVDDGDCCYRHSSDPIHSGDAHQAPPEAWVTP